MSDALKPSEEPRDTVTPGGGSLPRSEPTPEVAPRVPGGTALREIDDSNEEPLEDVSGGSVERGCFLRRERSFFIFREF